MIQNDGNRPDVIALKGTGSVGAWRVHYLLGTRDITSKVVAGTYRTARLGVGKSVQITLVIAVPRTAAVGTSKSWLENAKSATNPLKKDAVKATVKAIA